MAVTWEIVVRRGIPWGDLEALQQRLLENVKRDPSCGFLLLSEPTATFTRGASAPLSDRLWSEDECRARGVETHLVDRGGKWTYHGPGQILVYPIVALPALGFHRRDATRFLNAFRDPVVSYLRELGVPAEGRDRPFGIFTPTGKIASVGVSLRGGFCSHGMALYLEDQTTGFSGINPCGVSGERIASVAHFGVAPPWEIAADALTERVKKGFQMAKTV